MIFKHCSVMIPQLIDSILNPYFNFHKRKWNNIKCCTKKYILSDKKIYKIYIDCTFGCGSHSMKISNKLNINDVLITIDKDQESIKISKFFIKDKKKIISINKDFSKNIETINFLGIKIIDGVFFDIGLSFIHLKNNKRGFSLKENGPLDMRINKHQKFGLKKIIYDENLKEIKKIIKNYGNEKLFLKISKKIIYYRKKNKINNTKNLLKIILKPFRQKNFFLATRTFQAFRIHVNKELEEIIYSIIIILKNLSNKGIITLFSFHSIEDRIVKNFIKLKQINGIIKSFIKIKADQSEVISNKSSRSVIIRVGKKII